MNNLGQAPSAADACPSNGGAGLSMARFRLELGPVPMHHQVYLHLKAALDSGEIAPGDRLPPERELCVRYNCSLITIRRALSELAREGRLERTRGRGTFALKPRIERDFADTLSFTRGDAAPRPRPRDTARGGPAGVGRARSSPARSTSRSARRSSTSSASGSPRENRSCSNRSTCRPSGFPASWPPTSSTTRCTTS